MKTDPSAPEQWYAVYVMPQSEKKVFDRIRAMQIDVYLPLRRSLRQWSDRKKWIEEPLIRGYVFVRIRLRDQVRVLEVPGVLQFVRFDKQPVPIPDDQIDALRTFLDSGYEVDVADELLPGEEVEVTEGLLTGMRGQMLERRGKKIFAVQLEHLGKTLIVAVPAAQLRRP